MGKRDAQCIVDLGGAGERRVEARTVSDRLAVAADRAHVSRSDAGLSEQLVDRAGKEAAERRIKAQIIGTREPSIMRFTPVM